MKKMTLWLKKKVVPWALPPLAAGFIRILGATLRIEVRDESGSLLQRGGGGVLFAFWHNRILMLPYLYEKYCPGRQVTVMISRSRDGKLIADIAAKFGVEAARGSTSKHGSDAFRTLVRKLRSGNQDVGITPDGPRGPLHSVQPGVVALAQKTQCPVVTLTCHYDRKWELKSWDRFQIPKPFARCTLVVGKPILPDSADLAGQIARQLAG